MGNTYKKIVIIDIDGTVADLQDRLHHITGNAEADWDAFFDACEHDRPFQDMVDLLYVLDQHYWFVFITGRPERIRATTNCWLRKVLGQTQTAALFMRADGDFRPDDVVKKELFEKSGILPSEVAFVLEDRDRVVKMWRDIGIRCLQVEEGSY